ADGFGIVLDGLVVLFLAEVSIPTVVVGKEVLPLIEVALEIAAGVLAMEPDGFGKVLDRLVVLPLAKVSMPTVGIEIGIGGLEPDGFGIVLDGLVVLPILERLVATIEGFAGLQWGIKVKGSCQPGHGGGET